MGIISRLFNLFRANANDMLDKAEDPEKMLQQMLSDLEVQKQKAKKQMTEALALQKRLERDTEKEHKEADKYKTVKDKINNLEITLIKIRCINNINKISKKIDISSGLEDNPGVKSSKKVSDFLLKVKKL